MTTEPILRVEDLSVSYTTDDRQRLALDRVDLRIDPGEILGLVGESGSGKSTLSTAILGLLPANAQVLGGEISLQGHGDLARLSREDMRSARGSEIAMIFQDPATSLNPRLPVGKQLSQVVHAHEGRSASSREVQERLVNSLSDVGIPDPERALHRFPHEFSGGMRQRVMVAMSLLLRPKLVIADEATSALDVTLEAQILELLLRLRDEHGTSLLFVSHDLGVVSQMCDRVAVMYAGRVIEEVTGAEVLSAPAHPYTQALDASLPTRERRGRRLATVPGEMPDLSEPASSCSFAARCPHAAEICWSTIPSLYPTVAGSARCLAWAPGHEATWERRPQVEDWELSAIIQADAEDAADAALGEGTPLLVVDHLSVHFPSRSGRLPIRAVDDVSLRLDRGRVLGIVGESGSGKTTLGEALARLLRPTSGTITFDGADTTSLSGAAIRGFRRTVQMIFQSPYASLSPRMRIGKQVTEPYRIHRIDHAGQRTAADLLHEVNLPASLARSYPSGLSGGQARRVGIARALATGPALVVADEPTSGLDQSAAAATINLLGELREQTGLSIVLISHSLPQVMAVADEICVMYFGQIVERGTTESVTTRPGHPYTRALIELAPDPDPDRRLVRRRLLVQGEVPSSENPPTGCRFHPRCLFARDVCRTTTPPEVPVPGADTSQKSACHFAAEFAAGVLTPTRRSS